MVKTMTDDRQLAFDGFETKSPIEKLKTQMFAGAAKLTITSKRTGERFTLKFRSAAKDRDKNWTVNNQDQSMFFVSYLNGPNNDSDYAYLGFVRINPDSGEIVWHHGGHKAKARDTAPVSLGTRYLLDHVRAGRVPDGINIDHAGSCARCGRALTVPESIRSGFGPECISHVA